MWSGGISSDICDALVSEGMKGAPLRGSIFSEDATNQNNEVRKSTIRWCNHAPWVLELLNDYVVQANRVFHAHLAEKPTAEIQFTEYHGTEQGKYDSHIDVNWEADNLHDRKLSIIVQLSDPSSYEGGNFQLVGYENPLTDQLRARGTVLVFPSYLEHCVLPVTSGVRYSMVSWFEGPRWR